MFMDHKSNGQEKGMDVHGIAQVLGIPRRALGEILDKAGLDREHILEHGITGAEKITKLFQSARDHGYNKPPSDEDNKRQSKK